LRQSKRERRHSLAPAPAAISLIGDLIAPLDHVALVKNLSIPPDRDR